MEVGSGSPHREEKGWDREEKGDQEKVDGRAVEIRKGRRPKLMVIAHMTQADQTGLELLTTQFACVLLGPGVRGGVSHTQKCLSLTHMEVSIT